MNGKTFLLPLARLLMSSLFVWDGVVQLRNPGGTAQYFASVHIPAPDVAVWISILVDLPGGLALSGATCSSSFDATAISPSLSVAGARRHSVIPSLPMI